MTLLRSFVQLRLIRTINMALPASAGPNLNPVTQINRRREEFPTLSSGIHLLSHSLGPVPRATRDSMRAYVEAWEHHTGEDAWATSWWEMSTDVGDRIARIIGGEPGSVQVQPN